MTTITLSTSHNPATAEADETSATELYDALEDWKLQRSINGRGRNEASAHFRAIADPEIRRIKDALHTLGLPTNERPDWLADAEQADADAADERAAVEGVRYGG